MAETLGSLIDKLAICDLKIWHCHEQLFGEEFPEQSGDELHHLAAKSLSLGTQRERLIDEINEWLLSAITQPQATILTDPKNKLYGHFRRE
jgi:hypothetical protein